MAYFNISYRLEPGSRKAIKKAIAEIEANLPFLITLQAKERLKLVKLGPRSTDFVMDALVTVQNFPQILPSSFDTEGFTNDTSLFDAMSEIKTLLDSLCEKVNHTYLAVGNEAMTGSLEVYTYVQTAAGRTPGLRSVEEKLRERFKAQGKRRSKEESNVENQDEDLDVPAGS